MAKILFNTAFMWTSISNRLTLPAKNAELQLGIHPVNNLPMTLKSKRRPAHGCHLQNDAL